MDFRRSGRPPELYMTNQLKVLYIAGLGRSGSTILQNVLGELESFFPGGEICSIGQRYVQKRLCGCKKPLAECDVWKRVLNRAFGQFDRGKAVGTESAFAVLPHPSPPSSTDIVGEKTHALPDRRIAERY